MRQKLTTLALCIIAMLASPLVNGAEYLIDIEGMHASIEFRIKHLGYSWLVGRFNDFSGSFIYDSAHPGRSSVEVVINPASIDSNHAKRDKHLRGKDFLHVDKYPQASFKSTRVAADDEGHLTITGDLTLRGVSREIIIAANKVGSGPDPWGGFRMGFSGSTTLVLADFGMKKFLGPSSTTVELLLQVEGIRQEKRKTNRPQAN